MESFDVTVNYIFSATFTVQAENKEQANQKIKDHCGCRICPVVSTLPDEEINWSFNLCPETKIIKTKKKR